jgi:lysozyme
MEVSMTNIHDQLGRDEGCRLKPYKDSKGLWTVGIGRCLDTNPLTSEEKEYLCQGHLDRDLSTAGLTLTLEEAHYLLDNDIAKVRSSLTASIDFYKRLDDARQGSLINMGFNLGIRNLMHFPRMLGAMSREDWQTAHDEVLSSKYASDVGDRAKRVAQQILTGEWV